MAASSRLRFEQAVKRDRKFARADAGRVPDCIGDRPRRAGDADFTDPLDAKRIDVRVVFLDQDRFERGHIANPPPQIRPPWSWLGANRGLMIRPAAKAPRSRVARICPRSGSALTSANT